MNKLLILIKCRFPSEKQRSKQWLEVLGETEENIKPFRKYTFICSAHFRPEDILISKKGKKTLKFNANPIKPEANTSKTARRQLFEGPSTSGLVSQKRKKDLSLTDTTSDSEIESKIKGSTSGRYSHEKLPPLQESDSSNG